MGPWAGKGLRILLAVVLGGLAACGRAAPPDPRPNVLLVVVDTLRADALGVYGAGPEASPEIDALARGGVVFERAIAAAPWTAPSHAALFTSRYSREHSIGFETGTTRLTGLTTLAQVFRAAGYSTAAFVSNIVLLRRYGWDLGFDRYDDELTAPEPNRPEIVERVAEDTARSALDWLARQGDEPFFLWVHLQDPHGPYDPPEAFRERVRARPEPGEKPLPRLPGNRGRGGIPGYQALEGLDLPSQYRARYRGEVLYADHWVAEIVRAVEEHASGRGALVAVTSDHGESLGEGGYYFLHGFATTPELARVPLILRAPGLLPGRRAEPVSHVDVMPTLLELAGLEAPPGARGLALGPYLREGTPLPERWVYCDLGSEVGAYAGDGFLLGHDVPTARRPNRMTSWTRYAWKPGVTSLLLERGVRPDAEIERYVAQRPPEERLEVDDESARRLRALGYLGD